MNARETHLYCLTLTELAERIRARAISLAAGAPIHRDYRSPEDGTVVRRLRILMRAGVAFRSDTAWHRCHPIP